MTNMLHIIVSFCTEMLLDDDVGSGIKEMMESSNVASQLIKRNGEHISWLVWSAASHTKLRNRHLNGDILLK